MTQHFTTPANRSLAYRQTTGTSGHNLVWLSGFNSDMQGSKVLELEGWAKAAGHGFLAFDYSGHGESGGNFQNGTISAWRDDTLAILEALTDGPQILVGSSMGGWIALLAAIARPGRVSAMVLIAPAPDFTAKLMWPSLPADAQIEITQAGVWMQPSDYGEPVPITRALIEDGARNQVLNTPIAFDGPVRILQGMQDPDVPWRHAESLVTALTTDDLTFTLVKDGDHRLSRPQDIARLVATCHALTAPAAPPAR
ncbi:MAG: alpha/beta hydrolase [Pseudomonadota bacterium]